MASEARSVRGCGTRTIAKPELVDETIWLCPIEDRRALDSSREGMVEGFSLGTDLMLVDYSGRLFRNGEVVISADLFASSHGWAAASRAGARACRG
jgi:hypothetical protein